MLKKIEYKYIVYLLLTTMVLLSFNSYYAIEISIYGDKSPVSKEFIKFSLGVYFILQYLTIASLIVGFIKIIIYDREKMFKIIGKFLLIIIVSLIIAVIAKVIMINNIPSAQYAKVAPIIMYMEIPKYLPMITTISMALLFFFTQNNQITYRKDEFKSNYSYIKEIEANKVKYIVSNIQDDSFLKLQTILYEYYNPFNFVIKVKTNNEYILRKDKKSIQLLWSNNKIFITFTNIEEDNLITHIW